MKKLIFTLIIAINFSSLKAMEDMEVDTLGDKINNIVIPQIKTECRYNAQTATIKLAEKIKFVKYLRILNLVIFVLKNFPNHTNKQILENIRQQLDSRLSQHFLSKLPTFRDPQQSCLNLHQKVGAQSPIQECSIEPKIYFPIEENTLFSINSTQLTPLFWAAIFGLEIAMIQLIHEEAPPEGTGKTNIILKNPLYYCVKNGMIGATALLLQMGANPDGATVKALTEDCSDPLNIKLLRIHYITPLHQAVLWACAGRPEILASLLKHGANRELESGPAQIQLGNMKAVLSETPLQWAQTLRCEYAVQLLTSEMCCQAEPSAEPPNVEIAATAEE